MNVPTAPSPYNNTTPGYGPNDYLAIYLTVKFGWPGEYVTIPVRHFGSTLARLHNALHNLPILKSKDLARQEAQKIETSGEAAILLDSTLPGRKNIIRKNMHGHNIQLRLATLLHKLATRQSHDPIDFSIRAGMKTFSMPYPEKWVDPFTNFKPGSFMIDSSDVRNASIVPFVVDNNAFFAVHFKPIVRAVFMDV